MTNAIINLAQMLKPVMENSSAELKTTDWKKEGISFKEFLAGNNVENKNRKQKVFVKKILQLSRQELKEKLKSLDTDQLKTLQKYINNLLTGSDGTLNYKLPADIRRGLLKLKNITDQLLYQRQTIKINSQDNKVTQLKITIKKGSTDHNKLRNNTDSDLLKTTGQRQTDSKLPFSKSGIIETTVDQQPDTKNKGSSTEQIKPTDTTINRGIDKTIKGSTINDLENVEVSQVADKTKSKSDNKDIPDIRNINTNGETNDENKIGDLEKNKTSTTKKTNNNDIKQKENNDIKNVETKVNKQVKYNEESKINKTNKVNDKVPNHKMKKTNINNNGITGLNEKSSHITNDQLNSKVKTINQAEIVSGDISKDQKNIESNSSVYDSADTGKVMEATDSRESQSQKTVIKEQEMIRKQNIKQDIQLKFISGTNTKLKTLTRTEDVFKTSDIENTLSIENSYRPNKNRVYTGPDQNASKQIMSDMEVLQTKSGGFLSTNRETNLFNQIIKGLQNYRDDFSNANKFSSISNIQSGNSMNDSGHDNNPQSNLSNGAFQPELLDIASDNLARVIQTGNGEYRTNLRGALEQFNKIVTKGVNNNRNQIKIQLEPESLGKINIDLKVKDGQVMARLMVENEGVKDYLEQNTTGLKNSLGKQGFNLEQFEIQTRSEHQFTGDSREHMGSNQQQADQNQEQDQNNPAEDYYNQEPFESLTPDELERIAEADLGSYIQDYGNHKRIRYDGYYHRMNLLA